MALICPKCHSENPETKQFCADCGTQLPPFRPTPSEMGTERAGHSETWQKAPESADLAAGSTFAGRYQVIEELGRGGMGKVYRALDKKLNEEVALKLIRPDISSNRQTILRFSNELKLARRIAHRNVGKMYELMEADGVHFITMEYVPGQDLRGLIRQTGQLTPAKAVSIAAQICEGLAEAHSLGVIHRDLKPGNILIDRNGDARIMDFGIARSLSVKGQGLTGAGAIIGTPEYMSPEQVEGKEADQRSDIYSLGIILFEMLTGRVPFEGNGPLAAAVKKESVDPPDPRLFAPQIPEDLGRAVLKCLEEDKEKRFQSAAELFSELVIIKKNIPTAERALAAGRTSAPKTLPARSSVRKNLVPVLLGAAAVLIAVGIFLLIWGAFSKNEPLSSRPPAGYAVSRSGARRALRPVAWPASGAAAKHSIAVLPFEDLSPAKDHEYLCEGIAETLINSLCNIEDLWIPARASSFSFKGKDIGIRDVGRQLGVDNLLQAGVQVIGTRLRITPKIISAADGTLVWSGLYDRQMEDVFAIQDELAVEIVKALKVKLLGEKESPIIRGKTTDPEAYQAYLKGRFCWNKRTIQGMKESLGHFEQAIKEDPSYALAYVGLADGFITLAEWFAMSSREAFPRAKEAALKALAIDERLGEAHNSLGSVLRDYEWDWKGAENEYKRAIELSPNYATAHQWYGELLTIMGRFDEALKEIRHAQALDPLSLIANAIEGWFYYYARDYDRGIAQCLRVLEMDPGFPPAHNYLAINYLGKGMYEEALREAEISKNPSHLARICAATNRREEALRFLAEISEGSNQCVERASAYFHLGRKDEAWTWLEKAFEKREYALIYLKMAPHFDGMRQDPRFQALMKKLGFI